MNGPARRSIRWLSRFSGWNGIVCSTTAPRLPGGVGYEEEFVGIEQGEGAQMSLGNEPDLSIGVGPDEIAFAGLRWVVHAEHFVDELRIETGILDGVGAGDGAGFEWVELDPS